MPDQVATRWMQALARLGLIVCCTGLVGCADAVPPRAVPNGDPELGRIALQEYGCGACHSIPGVERADGVVAPPLERFAERAYVAGVISNRPDNLIRWIRDPQEVDPQTAMPDLGVSLEDARDMAAYLYTLR